MLSSLLLFAVSKNGFLSDEFAVVFADVRCFAFISSKACIACITIAAVCSRSWFCCWDDGWLKDGGVFRFSRMLFVGGMMFVGCVSGCGVVGSDGNGDCRCGWSVDVGRRMCTVGNGGSMVSRFNAAAM